jgi:hypothetical protein
MSKHEDERIVKTNFEHSEMRADRATADKEREVDDALRSKIAALRSGFSDNILPDVEGEPGYHYCWLSTTNQSDPIYRRLRLGYELVKHDELKYLGEQNRVQSGEFAGCVSINELVLAKIPNELYQEIMYINHHEKPMGEEELLRANMEGDEEDSNGRRLGESYGDGIQNLGRRVSRPTFR